ncbi:EamA family transporter [Pseudomonas sp. SWRI111]|uniref:EamA family transporter n=1 Tax=Pseudomonas sp. SWRI111 TaxID=2745507 RepID=UPI0016453A30|nr:EamA family transporter [Pseudomonas sp. SWRI111]MBC3208207.1 EamA family transporter [Pseudomonas sp. SWRI111]
MNKPEASLAGIATPVSRWVGRAGILYVAAFLVLANANAVFSGNLLQQLHPFTFLFWSFVITSGFFLTRLLLSSGTRGLAIDANSAGPLTVLNFTSALNWIGYFYALRYIEPAIVSAIMGGLGPVSTILLERVVRRRQLPLYTYAVAAGILSGTALLAWASLVGLAGIRPINVSDTLIGLAAAAAGGASQALNTIATKQLGERSWTATRIMAHRFYLLIFVAAVLAYSGPGFAIASSTQIGGLAIATLLGVIIPLWLLQRGILLSEPFTVAALLAWAPLLTYVFQVFDARIQWSMTSALGCSVIALVTVFGTWMKFKGDRK